MSPPDDKERYLYPLTLLLVNSSLYQGMLLMFAKDLCSTVIIADNLSSNSFKSFMKNSNESPEVYTHSKKQIVLSDTKHECMTALRSRRSPLVIIRSFQCFICTPGVQVCSCLAWGKIKSIICINILKF